MLACRLIVLVVLVTELQVSMGYDEEIAKNFASLSSVMYCMDMTSVVDWTCRVCKQSRTPLAPGYIKIIDGGVENATRMMVAKLGTQNGCLVAMRGSYNTENWLRGSEWEHIIPSTFKHCHGCEVHEGFYDIWRNLHPMVAKALVDLGCGPSANNPNNLLHLTGHSLGAALLQLGMFTLKNAGFNIHTSYSFESPRVGNKAFADAFAHQFTRHDRVFRITHSEDPAVHYPLEELGFQHAQQEIFYDSSGKWKTCPKVEDPSCAGQYEDVPGMMLFDTGDHCTSPLVKSGSICNPTAGGCASPERVVV